MNLYCLLLMQYVAGYTGRDVSNKPEEKLSHRNAHVFVWLREDSLLMDLTDDQIARYTGICKVTVINRKKNEDSIPGHRD